MQHAAQDDGGKRRCDKEKRSERDEAEESERDADERHEEHDGRHGQHDEYDESAPHLKQRLRNRIADEHCRIAVEEKPECEREYEQREEFTEKDEREKCDDALAGHFRRGIFQLLKVGLSFNHGAHFHRRFFLRRVVEIAVYDRILAECELLTFERHIAAHMLIDDHLAARELHIAPDGCVHTEHAAGPEHVATYTCTRDACLTASHNQVVPDFSVDDDVAAARAYVVTDIGNDGD